MGSQRILPAGNVSELQNREGYSVGLSQPLFTAGGGYSLDSFLGIYFSDLKKQKKIFSKKEIYLCFIFFHGVFSRGV